MNSTQSGILLVEKFTVAQGKKCATYGSAFKGVKLEFHSGGVQARILPNEDVADRLHVKWQTMRFPEASPTQGDCERDEALVEQPEGLCSY